MALVVVIEIGGAGAREFNKFSSIAPPLAPMLASIVGNVPHKVAVVAFDSQPTLLQSLTTNLDSAADVIADLTPGCSRQHHLDNCASPLAIHNLALGDNGAAILDALAFSVDLLRKQPPQYRRAVLLISETLDRGSHLTLEDALRAISDTNTVIYSIGYSTGKSEAAHYAARELPTQPGGLWMENHHPNPPNGCMGKDPDRDPDATHNKAIQAYDCLTQLVPPLALAKMAAIAATDGLKRNVPETVAHLTGGEYFKLPTPRPSTAAWPLSPTTFPTATYSASSRNRRTLAFMSSACLCLTTRNSQSQPGQATGSIRKSPPPIHSPTHTDRSRATKRSLDLQN